MLDLYGLADDSLNRFEYKTGMSGTQVEGWQKPRGINLVFIWMCGGGGGGGGGFSAASGNARGGGASGASAAMLRLIIPAIFLPDLLFIQVGLGGVGGIAAANGSNGGASIISLSNTLTSANLFMNANGGGLGNAGTGAAGGVAGVAGTTSAISTMVLASLGMYLSVAGDNGKVGGGVANVGVAFVPLANTTTLGGGGSGAGSTASQAAGGDITGAGIINTIPGGLASGGRGSDGIVLQQPFIATGGSGGGSFNTGVGGNGGNAAIGSGGGGGGGGTTGGSGGRGGDGYVLIIAT